MRNTLGDELLDDEDDDETLDSDDKQDVESSVISDPISLKQTLLEMIAGMIFFGGICELAGVWWVKDKLACSIGLWIGVAIAAGMAIHMAWSFDRVMDLPEKAATNKVRVQSILRYGILLIIFAIILLTDFVHPLTAFLGVMSLKVSAYLQPFSHIVFQKFKKK